MRKTVNNLLQNRTVKVHGFPAFKALEEHTKQGYEEVVLSTWTPAANLANGITEYYSPVIPRGSRFETAAEIIAADLEVIKVEVEQLTPIASDDKVLIVTQHQGTMELLKEKMPFSKCFSGSVSRDDVYGHDVVGVLPPWLIGACNSFTAAVIKDYNAVVDGDLKGQELSERLEIADTIKVVTSEAGDEAACKKDLLARDADIVNEWSYEILEGVEHGPTEVYYAVRNIINFAVKEAAKLNKEEE